MISCDTNILFPAFDSTSPDHAGARTFLTGYADMEDFCICEQVLMELYCLLRNPAVCRKPLSALDAVEIIQGLRSNPHWRVVDVTLGGTVMDQVWKRAAESGFAYRRVFDVRIAATLQHHGVTQFATRNMGDFDGLGFDRVWDPLSNAG